MKEFFVFDEAIRRLACKREYTNFANYIGQNGTVERILDLVYSAYGNTNHIVQENIMFAGPPSTGKTTLAKMLADQLGNPGVFTDAHQINSGVSICGEDIAGGPDTAIHLILDAYAKLPEGPLEGVQTGSFELFKPDGMVFFIDEIHGLNRKAADAFLKATERSDGMLIGRDAVVDCRNVLWVGATTDWGKLPSAFRTRFIRMDLISPTPEEVAQIVSMNMQWDMEISRKIVFYGSVIPRETLAFARSVQRYAEREGSTPAECVWAYAQREGIDEFGMRRQRVEILKALKDNPNGLILRNLCAILACEVEEMVKYWLPPLLFAKPALVKNDRGYQITPAGLEELKKRSI